MEFYGSLADIFLKKEITPNTYISFYKSFSTFLFFCFTLIDSLHKTVKEALKSILFYTFDSVLFVWTIKKAAKERHNDLLCSENTRYQRTFIFNCLIYR